MTKTFKNSNFTKRDYECTNLVMCTADEAPAPYWIEVDEEIPAKLQMLYIEHQNGKEATYYGYL